MRHTREQKQERDQRLNQTAQGAALQKLARMFGSYAEMAEHLGVARATITLWLSKERISRGGAVRAESLGLMSREKLRPDVRDWAAGTPGRHIGESPNRDGADQLLLRDLVEHCGSVRILCKKAGITSADFHRWNSRNRISGRGVAKLSRIRGLPAHLRARIDAVPR